MSARARTSSEPIGDCYRWAYHFILKHPDALLRQGLVTAPYSEEPPFEHAWIVHNHTVKDWQTMVAGFGGRFSSKGYPEEVWNALWKPTRVKDFDRRQALLAAARAEHYGPW